MLRVTFAALAVLSCVACDGGASTPAANEAAKPEAKAQPEAAGQDAKSSEPLASEAPVAEPAEADPLGQRFRDPAWFNNTMFGDKGTRVDFARSEANEAGLFKSHIIFELSEGTTTEDCAAMISERLKDIAPLSPEEQSAGQPEDRIQLAGSTDRYDVTAVCGEGKGKMRAYVAYEWTR